MTYQLKDKVDVKIRLKHSRREVSITGRGVIVEIENENGTRPMYWVKIPNIRPRVYVTAESLTKI